MRLFFVNYNYDYIMHHYDTFIAHTQNKLNVLEGGKITLDSHLALTVDQMADIRCADAAGTMLAQFKMPL